MAKLVLNNASVTVNSVDLSDYVTQVTIVTDVNEVPTTAMGDTAITRVGGLKDSSISIDWQQDYAASKVEATLYPLIGSTTTIVVKAVDAAVSVTNPSYTMTALIASHSPVAGAVGELSTFSVTYPISGEITKATS